MSKEIYNNKKDVQTDYINFKHSSDEHFGWEVAYLMDNLHLVVIVASADIKKLNVV